MVQKDQVQYQFHKGSRAGLSTRLHLNFMNDPTAGSPTVTLLRLLLPLNDQVWLTSQTVNPLLGYGSIREPH